MAERFLFFNSNTEDRRKYHAQDFAEYFGSVLSTGLLHVDKVPGMSVRVETGTLNTVVSPGKAIMRGHLYENTTPLTLVHSIPEPNLDRIDRIVLRLNLNNAVRDIRLRVLEGAPTANPVAPELVRTQFIHDISLAQIRVRANTSRLDPLDLVDERMIESLCGLVYSLISVPTTVFQQQWDTWFNTQKQYYQKNVAEWTVEQQAEFLAWRAQEEADFAAWLSTIQGILDGDVAGNLLSIIEGHKADTSVHLQPGERNSWNAKQTIQQVEQAIERNFYTVKRSSKDEYGTFKIVEHFRQDGKRVRRAVLSGTAPNYAQRSLVYYDTNGTTAIKTVNSRLTYDADGDFIGEVAI